MIPYGKQSIDEEDIEAVAEVLRSDILTTGPWVETFEKAVAKFVGMKYGVAVSSGTAALHCAMSALCIRAGDEVVVTVMSFAATANCVVYQGAKPVFVDIIKDTLLIDPEDIERKITEKTRAIIAMDYAGHPCNYDLLRSIAEKYQLKLIADSCHALGAEYKNQRVGSLADMTIFSFHPIKHITTGEGGMVLTNDITMYEKMNRFRNHGIDVDFKKRQELGSWTYQITDLGYNYRLSDIQCALGLSQLRKLPIFLEKRRQIAAQYDLALSDIADITPLKVEKDVLHAYHLYVIRILDVTKRKGLFKELRNKGIGVNIHYIPIHHHPFYNRVFGYSKGDFPLAEGAYKQILSLPIFPTMTDNEVKLVVNSIKTYFEGT